MPFTRLVTNMAIKAAIFDLDGVIVDTEPQSQQADDMVLGKHGIVMDDTERREAIGRRIEEIFGDVVEARKLDISVGKLVKEKDEVFNGLIKGKLGPISGSVELIRSLKERGLALALATSSGRVKMQAELDELGVGDLFDVKVNGDEISRGKPDPEIFLKAAGKLGVRPEECIVIEDAAFGVKAAKAAGMKAVGFRSPNSIDQDLSAADMVVDDLGLVIEHLPAIEGG